MNLPSTLYIGAHDVRLVIETSWPGDTGNVGEWDVESSTIHVRKGLSETLTFATILHEAMHVMNATIDHSLLDSLSEQVTQFLWDNEFIQPE